MAKLSPMMEQYLDIKKQYSNCILFFRLGDFYEMFFEDAQTVSKELDLTLTGRDYGQTERAPMCGIPHHAADTYIARLMEKGYKVAICDQVEDAKQAKGLVKREVVRIVSPGTIIDNNMLDETKNNYVCSIFVSEKYSAVSFADVSTGEFSVTDFSLANFENKLLDILAAYSPSEIISNKNFYNTATQCIVEERFTKVYMYDESSFKYKYAKSRLESHFNVSSLKGFGIEEKTEAVSCSGALLNYLYETQKNSLSHLLNVKYFSTNDFMLLDISSRRNLELTENMRDKTKKGTLLWALDKTKTSMGSRLIRKWIEQPLLNIDKINKRLYAVEELLDCVIRRDDIRQLLKNITDIERTMSKVVYLTATARDLISLKNSIGCFPSLKKTIADCTSPLFKELYEIFDTLDDIYELINNSISDEPSFSIKDGDIIKTGYSEEVDKLRFAKNEGSTWVLELEENERRNTGIKNLKVRYNKVFGFYIEISKGNIQNVPDRYIRKQTLANCERYTTIELKQLEEIILGAEEKVSSLEHNIFCEIREKIAHEVKRIKSAANIVSILDCIQSLSEAAEKNNYAKPFICDDGAVNIVEGRHPVVELIRQEPFINNGTYLDLENDMLSIITGPNMAGKSTYMRQVALIVLMAQVGSYVPAKSAEISVVDKIFTRVGASDDLASGQSTFMVEMTEVANILNNATKNSLIILDEIGRGTSTFDGLSIAWAVLEYITDTTQIGAKTLFATHYHELTELEGKLPGVKNYNVSILEQADDIIFLRKIVRGGSDHSYGIQVARLSGLPLKVIKRAKEILRDLDDADITKKAKKIAKTSKQNFDEKAFEQVNIFNIKETTIIDEINKLDVNALTPMQALQKLYELQSRVKE